MDKANQGAAAQAVFTPGPWEQELDQHEQINIYGGPDHFWIALLPHQCVLSIEQEQQRNAALLVASPDAHAFATRFLRFFGDVPPEEYPPMIAEDPSVLSRFVEHARAYLAKAEGRSAPQAPPETP